MSYVYNVVLNDKKLVTAHEYLKGVLTNAILYL